MSEAARLLGITRHWIIELKISDLNQYQQAQNKGLTLNVRPYRLLHFRWETIFFKCFGNFIDTFTAFNSHNFAR